MADTYSRRDTVNKAHLGALSAPMFALFDQLQ
jgi:hypothetical protein